MTQPSTKKKRSKLKAALCAPIFVIVFIVGWSLYWIGQPRQRNTKQPQKPIRKTPQRLDPVELIAIPPQEKEMLAN